MANCPMRSIDEVLLSPRLTNILFCLIAFSCIHQKLGRNGLLHLLLD